MNKLIRLKTSQFNFIILYFYLINQFMLYQFVEEIHFIKYPFTLSSYHSLSRRVQLP